MSKSKMEILISVIGFGGCALMGASLYAVHPALIFAVFGYLMFKTADAARVGLEMKQTLEELETHVSKLSGEPTFKGTQEKEDE
jgi:hypothetical protein